MTDRTHRITINVAICIYALAALITPIAQAGFVKLMCADLDRQWSEARGYLR